MVVAQRGEQAVGGGRDGAGGAALDGLGQVPGEPRVRTPQVGEGGEQGGVGGTPGEDDIAALDESFLEGFDTHHRHRVAAPEQLAVDLGCVGERLDAAGVVEALEAFGGLVGVDQGEIEVQVLLFGDTAGEGRDLVDAGIAS